MVSSSTLGYAYAVTGQTVGTDTVPALPNHALPPVPPHADIVMLFKHCMEFTLSSAQFQDKTEDLRRVGINAQILAAHSRRGGAPLGVLVSEIGRLTHEINETLAELSASGGVLARTAMRITALGDRLERYKRAWDRGINGGGSQRLLSDHYLQAYREMIEDLRDIRQSLSANQSGLGDLRRATVFIPALVSLLNINVAEYQESEEQFRVAAGELTAFRNFIEEACNRMDNGLGQSVSTIERLVELGVG